jgi:hypothetical protein
MKVREAESWGWGMKALCLLQKKEEQVESWIGTLA